MSVRFKNEERSAAAGHQVNMETTGQRPGFYIGSVAAGSNNVGRVSGDPSEVELASSDEEGDDDGDAKESDGEGVRALVYGKHFKQMDLDTEHEPNSGSESDEDDEPSEISPRSSGPRDPSLAPLLAARATGIEKVLQAMLAQPPSSPPRSPSPPPYALHSSHSNSQHYRAPPSSTTPSVQSNGAGDQSQVLPNGLRLRLALMALVNDVFERQPPPGEHQSNSSASDDGSPGKPGSSSGASSSSESSKQVAGQSSVASLPPLPPPSLPSSNALPPELAALAQISSQPFYETPSLPSFHTLTSSGTGTMSVLSPIGATQTSPTSTQSTNRGASTIGKGSMESTQPSPQQSQRPPPPLFSWTRPTGPGSPASHLPSSPHSATLSAHDKDPDRATNSPTSQSLPRYPSSWKRGSQKNQPDKSAPIILSNPGLTKLARGRAKELYMAGCYAKPSATNNPSTSSFRTSVPMYNYSNARPPTLPPSYPLKKLKLLCPRHLRDPCRICTPPVVPRGGLPSTRIGAGLLKKKWASHATKQTSSVVADLIPRFLRLSALVAMELGREARGEEPEANDGQEIIDKPDASEVHPPESPLLSPVPRGGALHAQPTRAWFALLCGLLTRAVLEGYVARNWKGAEYAEVILGVGLGIKGIGTRRGAASFGTTASASAPESPMAAEDRVDDLEPDEMPRLVDAGRVLFSGLVQDVLAPGSKDKATRGAEDEYVVEMEERLSEFLTVAHTTSDLATHFTQLSEKYPAEPVERAALRFCEAVAKWRGKPELELYKRQPHRCGTKSKSSTPLPLSIEALLASTPTPVPRPPIDKYFRVPPRSSSAARLLYDLQLQPPLPLRVLKRQRSLDADLEREAKKEKREEAGDGMDLGGGIGIGIGGERPEGHMERVQVLRDDGDEKIPFQDETTNVAAAVVSL